MAMEVSAWHLWFKRRGGRELRQLLMDSWDPIGVEGIAEAVDEYDGYLGPIAEKLRLGVDLYGIALLLHDIRTEAMGLWPDRGRDEAAASAIVA